MAGAKAGGGSGPDLREVFASITLTQQQQQHRAALPGLAVLGQHYPSAAQSHPLGLGWWQLLGNNSVCVCDAIPFSRQNQQDQQAAGEASKAAFLQAAAQRGCFGGWNLDGNRIR